MTIQQLEAALHVDECELCDVEYPTTELMRCAHCEALCCSYHSHWDLDCCRHPECLFKAASGLRLALIDMKERVTAAVMVLEDAKQRKISAAIRILGGKQ